MFKLVLEKAEETEIKLPTSARSSKKEESSRKTGQEATVRTGHGKTDWFQLGKGVRQGCMLSPCLLNLYAEYIMRNTGLEEAQAGIKIARRNVSHLRICR